MSWATPEKVLITGGHEVGGVASFAEGLSSGFAELGIPSEIILPSHIWSRWRDLRDERVLKILSTTGMLAVPLARRAICIVHGVPLVSEQGWPKILGLLACYKMTNVCSAAHLVAVSDYIAVHIRAFYNITTNAVVRNPVKPIFLQHNQFNDKERRYITYVGRLVDYKNVHRLLPAFRCLLDEDPNLRLCLIGDGPARSELQSAVSGDQRVEFKTQATDEEVRKYLCRTKVFVSAHITEGFGITYVEAMSQGCVVAMPASGGGVEIALQDIGERVFLLPISLEHREVVSVLRRALKAEPSPMTMQPYSARAVASAYLDVDRRFNAEPTSLIESVQT